LEILFNKNVDTKKWRELLDVSTYSSPFQTPEFFELYNKVENFSAEVIAVERNSKYLALIVVTIQKEKGIKGFFSRRGVVYGGPLLLTNEKKSLDFLLQEITEYLRKSLIYFEIRNNFNYSDFKDIFEKNGWKFHDHLNVQLNVENKSLDHVLAGMKYNRRREINISIKEGAYVRPAESQLEIEILYNILKELYLNRVKLPLKPYSYFINLFKSKIGKVFIVLHNNNIIGGSFCEYYENTSVNTTYYVGIRDYHKKIYPTHLAIIGVIEFAIENKIKIVDFMGAGKPNEKYGVRDYKLEFGGDLVEHGRFLFIGKPLLYKMGTIGIEFLTKMK